MKQTLAMIKKENSILLKNIIVYLSTLIVPSLLLFMNIYLNTHSTVKLNVGLISEDKVLYGIINDFKADNVKLKLNRYSNQDELCSAYKNSDIDAYITVTDDKNVHFFFDTDNTKGQLIYSYLAGAIQNYVAKDLQATNSDLLTKITEFKKYNLEVPTDIKIEKKSFTKSALLLSGVLWIILYTPLSTATNQITSEKKKKTLYMLYKAPVSPIKILFSKFTAVYLQFLLSISVYIFVARKFNLITENLTVQNFINLSLVLVSVSALGHCFGLIFNNAGIETIFSIVLVLPVIIVNSVSVSNFDHLLRILPTYYCAQIVNSIVSNETVAILNLAMCMLITIVCIFIFCFTFRRRDVIKLCTYLS
jgi:ABC-type transport system involved in multi-copper enzyme maturation permease subunit